MVFFSANFGRHGTVDRISWKIFRSFVRRCCCRVLCNGCACYFLALPRFPRHIICQYPFNGLAFFSFSIFRNHFLSRKNSIVKYKQTRYVSMVFCMAHAIRQLQQYNVLRMRCRRTVCAFVWVCKMSVERLCGWYLFLFATAARTVVALFAIVFVCSPSNHYFYSSPIACETSTTQPDNIHHETKKTAVCVGIFSFSCSTLFSLLCEEIA